MRPRAATCLPQDSTCLLQGALHQRRQLCILHAHLHQLRGSREGMHSISSLCGEEA
jgi:hypothetical protein